MNAPIANPWRMPLEWLGLARPDCAITCVGGGDGLGAQVMARLSTRIFAGVRGIRYFHTPLQSLDHTPSDVPAAGWSARWESFLNYAAGAPPVPDMPLTAVPKIHRRRLLSGRLYSVKQCHKITDRLPQEWHALRDTLRANYHATPKPAVPGDGRPVLAVHVRRGDVAGDGENQNRFTPLDAVSRRIDLALARHGGPLAVQVHSQGSAEDFTVLADRFSATLHLDGDEFETFHALASAEALVMAKSSFSYLAGLISTGLCVHEPFWHPPMPDWISDRPS